jgi:hypothetical protein
LWKICSEEGVIYRRCNSSRIISETTITCRNTGSTCIGVSFTCINSHWPYAINNFATSHGNNIFQMWSWDTSWVRNRILVREYWFSISENITSWAYIDRNRIIFILNESFEGDVWCLHGLLCSNISRSSVENVSSFYFPFHLQLSWCRWKELYEQVFIYIYGIITLANWRMTYIAPISLWNSRWWNPQPIKSWWYCGNDSSEFSWNFHF